MVNQPLNRVLVQLRDAYNFQFSFNDDLLSKYQVTLKGSFPSKDQAVENLLKGLPFDFLKSDDVFMILPKKGSPPTGLAAPDKQNWTLKGRIVEAGTFEPLPFSHIIINNQAFVSDVSGSFSYTASADSTFRVRVSHLGYYIFDTLVTAGLNQQFRLLPANAALPEVTVEHSNIEKSAIVGEKPGEIKLNHYISKFIPGQGDNSVFNLLRLMPGVLAAGEQSSDLLIWGGYESHSQVTFDGFTLFGLKNFNDNISVVNPFMLKTIDVLKGGYGVQYGDRVGAFVNISGKNGNMVKPSLTLNISTTTLNGLVELPLFRRSSLLLAYRQTYYNLYRNSNFNIFSPLSKKKPDHDQTIPTARQIDLQLNPESYLFRDVNLKYSWNAPGGALFYISLYQGSDHLFLEGEDQTDAIQPITGQNPYQFSVDINSTESYLQRGASTFLAFPFKNGNSSNLIISYSYYQINDSSSVESEDMKYSRKRVDESNHMTNNLEEFSIRNENKVLLSKQSALNLGLGSYFNKGIYTREMLFDASSDQVKTDTSGIFQVNWFYLFAENEFSLGDKFKGNIGARMIVTPDRWQLFPEPRISLRWNPSSWFTLHASAGRYHQFVFKKTTIDRNNNFSTFWTGSQENPLSAYHLISGVSFKKGQFLLNVESFYKPVEGITRTGYFPEEHRQVTWAGPARSYGFDIYVKQDFGPHALWLSYTLGRSEEKLSDGKTPATAYSSAPHDQRHELKAAAVVKLGAFHLATNYVFGSGVEMLRKIAEEQGIEPTYSRWDASLTYQFKIKRMNGEAGASILNLLNRQNVRYPNLKTFDIEGYGNFSVYTQSVPFTPTLFVQIKF